MPESVSQTSDRLRAHLSDLQQNPQQALDVRLFDEAEVVLPGALQDPDRLDLLRDLATSLTADGARDSSAKSTLLVKLFEDFTWPQVCDFSAKVHHIPFQQGLAPAAEMVPINRLMLALLSKATRTHADAAHLATMLDPDAVILSVVTCWLHTPDAGIASQAQQLLVDLLRVDREDRVDVSGSGLPRGGQGLVWKRLFGDRDVYAAIFRSCSLDQKDSTPAQATLAQARLLEWLPQVAAMDWSAISKSHHPDVEEAAGVVGGLLDFAALRMVDTRNDVLMHISLIDFFSALLATTRTMTDRTSQHESPGLHFVLSHQLHSRSAAPYLRLPGVEVDALVASFLYGPAAKYLAVYASHYPEHYMASATSSQVRGRLATVLDISPARWSADHGQLKHDLHLLASVPRKSLIHGGFNIVGLLPSRARNADVLHTLAAIFHGPAHKETRFPAPVNSTEDESRDLEEARYARLIYYNYLAANPRFWSDIAAHADTVALKDLALAAIHCLVSVIAANWSSLDGPDDSLPSSLATPDTGTVAVLTPPALEHTLPYLLKPPKTFANVVGGVGDSESAAYKISTAKFDALRAMHSRVVAISERWPGQGYEDIVATLSKRLQGGPVGGEQDQDRQVATLEL